MPTLTPKSSRKSGGNYAELGFYRVAVICPELHLGNVAANVGSIVQNLRDLAAAEVSLALFPELALSGYTVEDLFLWEGLLGEVKKGLKQLVEFSRKSTFPFVVGAPFSVNDGRVFNCAFVIHAGRIVGAIPKQFLANSGEFYEKRWFVAGTKEMAIKIKDSHLGEFLLSPSQTFQIGEMIFGVEICEDLWAPIPPSCYLALNGANVLLNLSASDDLISKPDYRRGLVMQQSARLNAAYLYSSSGPSESSKDLVFGGHLMIAENGNLLAESRANSFTGVALIAELDISKLNSERRKNITFGNSVAPRPIEPVFLGDAPALRQLRRFFSRTPFVPSDSFDLDRRSEEIIRIQSMGLSRRLLGANAKRAVIGISGGLDSTLALLICVEAMKTLGRENENVLAVTMPGFGTTDLTRELAIELANNLGVELREIPIGPATELHLKDIAHDGKKEDIVFENAQARERTQILFDLANGCRGIVVGTGDMSELWLGWCTFNADQMANYNVNVSVPKTLVKHLVGYYFSQQASSELSAILKRIVEIPISPELKRRDRKGGMGQFTEAIIGPYELHDFFLYHFLRNGFSVFKIYCLANIAFATVYPPSEIKKWLRVFFERGFKSQFKRTTLPPGPKVGTVSVSPRGDLRLPDELDLASLLEMIDHL